MLRERVFSRASLDKVVQKRALKFPRLPGLLRSNKIAQRQRWVLAKPSGIPELRNRVIRARIYACSSTALLFARLSMADRATTEPQAYSFSPETMAVNADRNARGPNFSMPSSHRPENWKWLINPPIVIALTFTVRDSRNSFFILWRNHPAIVPLCNAEFFDIQLLRSNRL